MEWRLFRKDCDEIRTMGELYVGDSLCCYCIEDAERQVKVPKETAIPRGRYQVKKTFSQRFQKETLQLLNVPGFTGIRIHPGNTEQDTEGCVIPGLRRDENAVYDSRRAVAELESWYDFADAKGQNTWITVEGLNPVPWEAKTPDLEAT